MHGSTVSVNKPVVQCCPHHWSSVVTPVLFCRKMNIYIISWSKYLDLYRPGVRTKVIVQQWIKLGENNSAISSPERALGEWLPLNMTNDVLNSAQLSVRRFTSAWFESSEGSRVGSGDGAGAGARADQSLGWVLSDGMQRRVDMCRYV